MVSEHHIRRALTRYLAGEVSLYELQEWFVPRAWELLDQDGETHRLAADIELLLAEFTGGHQGEPDLRRALQEHANAPMVLFGFPVEAAPGVAIYRTNTGSVVPESGTSNVSIAAASISSFQSPNVVVSKPADLTAA
jgi:hypothetical protein